MNLLTDPLLRVTGEAGPRAMTLPQVLAALGRVDDLRFRGIQRHQEDAFHVFLSYLGGAVLARRGCRDPVQGETFWCDGLRQLAGAAEDDAWSLVVSDATRPAFLQPPVASGAHGGLSFTVATPDQMDLLPTGRNHDVKRARSARARPDEWVFALVSLQSMSGYYGSGQYGISRMNGGHGSRPIVELVRTHSEGGRWRDAVLRLLDHRRDVLAGPFGYDPHGVVLVWVEPWDGGQSLPLSRLDPFYLEVCRRVRLGVTASGLAAALLGAQAPRIHAKDLRGVVGDPWLPIDLQGPASTKAADVRALTVSDRGFGADLLRRLLFADGLRLSALQRPATDWTGEVWLTASVLVRGEGTTEGFRAQEVRIPAPVRPRVFGPPAVRDPLNALCRSGIEVAAGMQREVLWPAVRALLAATEGPVSERDSIRAWWRALATTFEDRWSDAFFPWLWSVPASADVQAVLADWARLLRNVGLETLDRAAETLPRHTGRRYRARVAAQRVFWRCLYGRFPFLREEARDERTDPA